MSKQIITNNQILIQNSYTYTIILPIFNTSTLVFSDTVVMRIPHIAIITNASIKLVLIHNSYTYTIILPIFNTSALVFSDTVTMCIPHIAIITNTSIKLVLEAAAYINVHELIPAIRCTGTGFCGVVCIGRTTDGCIVNFKNYKIKHDITLDNCWNVKCPLASVVQCALSGQRIYQLTMIKHERKSLKVLSIFPIVEQRYETCL